MKWSIALDVQTALWRQCQKFTDWEDMRKRAWVNKDLDGEMVAHAPEMFSTTEVDADGALEQIGFRLLQTTISGVAPYYFTKETTQLLQHALPSYPMDSTPPAIEKCLTQAGFWYFEEPPFYLEHLDRQRRGIRVIVWARHSGGLFYVVCLEDATVPIPAFFGTWPNSSTITKGIAAIHKAFVGRYPDDEVTWLEQNAIREMRLLGAGLTFCYQHIFVDTKERAERGARRRMEAVTHEPAPDIHVVTLRRPTTSERDPQGDDVDWKWRWWVRGHWRQQPVGEGRMERETIWINSYVKGPEDRPLKPHVPTIFSVER